MLFSGRGHPGEDASRLGAYARGRVVTLASYGLGPEFIAEHVGLPLWAVRDVVAEEAELIESERSVDHDEW